VSRLFRYFSMILFLSLSGPTDFSLGLTFKWILDQAPKVLKAVVANVRLGENDRHLLATTDRPLRVQLRRRGE